MSLGVNMQILVDGILTAYGRQDWNAIQRLGERIRMMILDGVADKDRGGLSEAATKLEVAHALLPESSDGATQVQVHWMLKTDAALAKLAARRIAAPACAAGTEERSAKDRILRLLLTINSSPSVSSIATMTGLARETVSRLLPRMAAEGLIQVRRVGRKTLSRITAEGRITVGDRTGDVAAAIHNWVGLHDDGVMAAASSVVQRQAHRMAVTHTKIRVTAFGRDDNDVWTDPLVGSRAEVLSLGIGPHLTGTPDVMRMIHNVEENHRMSRNPIEIPA